MAIKRQIQIGLYKVPADNSPNQRVFFFIRRYILQIMKKNNSMTF